MISLLTHNPWRSIVTWLRSPTRALPAQPITVTLQHWQPVAEVDERYLSFSIDISLLAGGFWWEGALDVKRGLGTLRVPPIQLDLKKLDKLVQLLGPAYLRIGGSEADKIHYFNAPADEDDPLILTRDQWDNLHAFIQRNDLRFMFTCKYGLFNRRHHGSWRGDELNTLLQYSSEQGYNIDVFELGNELNAYWAFHGLLSQPRAKRLAQDYDRFCVLVLSHFPNARLCGPGSAFWPRLGETIRPISNITPGFLSSLKTRLDIVDWHYYPFQSERSPLRTRAAHLRHLLNPKSFEDYRKFSHKLSELRDRFQPQAELWTGETGSAQCGGQPELSDRWASSFWWADQLGMGARCGQKVMVRQSLVGGDYGMVARLTLKPRPDYWVSWLWGQMMGQQVFAVESGNTSLRCYLHSARNGEGKTLMLINLHDQAVQLDLNRELQTSIRQGYVMTAKTVVSRRVRINGMKVKFNSGRIQLADFPTQPFDGNLPPYSISFWHCQL
ncbi:glycoside hydrolase [Pseudomaricurvus sp. HS19]|uniref:glycoside hydrolase n=1 Tax=Pseudomaricurvus sp. HS19 TaxID=2692626 RepID=UPI00136C9C69|nr:glycoside hydrolase [Pseudomaricurvus sp. HS19]MYM63686.1 glycoside hydrolase [Pseudomaricurvus sp. HS19]